MSSESELLLEEPILEETEIPLMATLPSEESLE